MIQHKQDSCLLVILVNEQGDLQLKKKIKKIVHITDIHSLRIVQINFKLFTRKPEHNPNYIGVKSPLLYWGGGHFKPCLCPPS